METVIFILVALLAIALAWKLLTGIVKTVVLVAILIIAAIVVFGVLS